MIDFVKHCPVCGDQMEYRPNQMWTGMRYQTNVHHWVCTKSDHAVKFNEPATEEFRRWEKQR